MATIEGFASRTHGKHVLPGDEEESAMLFLIEISHII
jgi:hypothetical protein